MENYFTTNKGKAIYLIEKGYKLIEVKKKENRLRYIFEIKDNMKTDINNYKEANSILNIKTNELIKKLDK